VKVGRSSWLALLVRAQYPGREEVIAAHSSPVMAEVSGSPFMAAADAVTILEQIEGALAFIDTVGTRAEDRVYRRMRLALESAHRSLHNRMHDAGITTSMLRQRPPGSSLKYLRARSASPIGLFHPCLLTHNDW